ncbi:MAG: FtsQ-type POTRA domain-containing protein [Rhodospirillales bacterium]|nr:FtsQ-type POTRA domain-containing protein [Alphaproteobacteria bacterium]MCB9986993.1 FtsQ-type POTRA domain-containing protein [Rhodospirillales bacterium]USO08233.1 MAG: FtsQ-type POTRA domain-containing protein [Rhodospirillales bacterium]
MARGTRRAEMKARLTPRRLSWLGWFWGRVWFATKIAIAIVAVAGLLAWALAKGYVVAAGQWAESRIVAASADMGLRIDKVTVDGMRYVDPATLRRAIGVETGDALLGVDIAEARVRLVAIPWVRDAHLRRVWPDTLIVALDERVPAAIQGDAPGGPAVIDGTGVVLTHDDPARFGKLLMVAGAGAGPLAGALISLLNGQPELAVRVTRAALVSGRRWDLTLDNGTVLRLPDDDPGLALARAAQAQTEDHVFDQGYSGIDLRQKDRIILEGAPAKTPDALSKDGNHG